MLPRLSVRPTFARKTSDQSMEEAAMPLRPLSMAASMHTTDAFEPAAPARGQGIRAIASNAADRTAQVAQTALPYWREGLAFAFAVAVITWLGVLTQKMLGLEATPFCEDLPYFKDYTTKMQLRGIWDDQQQ